MKYLSLLNTDLNLFILREYISENGFNYKSVGKGRPILILHGLMGGLSNFDDVFNLFPARGYNVIAPELPIYTSKLFNTNVKFFANFVNEFVKFKSLKDFIILGNSLGGHVGLIYSKLYPNFIKGLVLTGSSGLYENSMGDSYPKREDYNFIKKKTESVFFEPKTATKDIVDEIFETVNNRKKLIKILAMAKSAIRHNMAKDLPKINVPSAIIWGKQDTVTPPEVAKDFNKLLPNSDLFWIDKCGHAPMMEHPKEFNTILADWLSKKNL
jgi:pimeloyl-ACP methyl ester carboxylesterase|tara:strand:+ start:351 stop:1157 length:807 start_codon:yes stop_codon:yes gene_type:complete